MPTKAAAPAKPRVRKPRATKPTVHAANSRRRTPTADTPSPQPSVTPLPHSRASVKRTYLFAVGRRKTAIARVRYTPTERETITINHQDIEQYFPQTLLRQLALQPLESSARANTGTFSIAVNGGGKHGQAEAVQLGIARVLVLANPELRPGLKHAGHLTRDPRAKERKKYGLKRARRAPQWQKR